MPAGKISNVTKIMLKEMKKSFYILATVIGGMAICSCENGDWDFPDFDHTAVYFAYQNPVRTITLGEDYYDTSMDNEHKCQIMATMGGVYDNKNDITIGIKVDNSICDGFKFEETGKDIVPMPSSYYTLDANQIVIPSGKILGGVTVNLTDQFFADPLATELNYVIPVVMTSVNGADSILVGEVKEGVNNPKLLSSDDWTTQPKNYILYAVKYISKYDANYLRRGVDNYSGTISGTNVRHAQYVEKDESLQDQFSTVAINTVEWARPTQDAEKNNVDCRLRISFDNDGNCQISSANDAVEATGTGKYVVEGDKNSWGGEDRDALYLDYTIKYSGITCASKDTLIVRDRGVKAEWFKYVQK